jgi:divalent metal cation (Fe/Co/Zn/Cd) transporter
MEGRQGHGRLGDTMNIIVSILIFLSGFCFGLGAGWTLRGYMTKDKHKHPWDIWRKLK